MMAELTAFPIAVSSKKRAQWASHLLCGLLSLVFLASAFAKFRSFHELESTLAASRLVPILLISQAAILLLVTETLLAFLLLLPQTRRTALYATTIVVSAFAAYSIWRWIQGIPVPCHCFGALLKLEPWQSVSLNAALLLVLGHSIALSTRKPPNSWNI